MDLKDKVALVTGGSRGIGRAICLEFAGKGAAVAINYRKGAADAEAVKAEIAGAGGRAIAIQADITSTEQVAAMVARVGAELGPVDILVNNAGVLSRGDLGDFDFSKMDLMRRTNVDGTVYVTRAIVDSMKERRTGRIINIASLAALGTAMDGTTFYAATKAAVAMLTRRFAMELGPFGITVNAIAPGYILTDMTDGGSRSEEMASRAMMRRIGYVEDIAHAAAYLASPRSSFVTAQVLTVDGGRMDFIAHG